MAIPWNEDDPRDAAVIVQNLADTLRQIARQARFRRAPSVQMARQWHRQIYKGASVPVPYYVGEIRDSDSRLPQLFGYEVGVGSNPGVNSSLVPKQLETFESAMQRAVGVLDRVILPGERPADVEQLRSVLTFCAYAHGEWVRIHPFANGNGRTARLWANWCALRYGLPPFVRLKPRPEGNYYSAASAFSMQGDHQPMIAVFARMLERYMDRPASPRS